MKIIVFGASGIIGSEVATQLSADNEVIRVSRSGDIAADYTDSKAVEDVFKQVSEIDAVIVTVGGDSRLKPYHDLTDDDFRFGAERKLIAQLRIVSLAEKYIKKGGSVTLTSGFLSHYPNPNSLATGPLNAAVDSYVQHAAGLLRNDIRLNVVSPAPVVDPKRVRRGLVSADQVAKYYLKSVVGNETGKVYRAWGGLSASQND